MNFITIWPFWFGPFWFGAPVNAFWQANFRCAVARLEELPPAGLPELAVLGRSNVGKSSAINALTHRRRLAYVSKTPGRTQTINLFDLGSVARLVDLPGYGYARVPQALRAQWDHLVGGYLRQRASLAAVILILDSRHPLTPQDRHLLEWLRPLRVPTLILISKCDKLSRAARQTVLHEVQRALAEAHLPAELRLFSSHSGEGVDEVRTLLEDWLGSAQPIARNKKPPEKGM